MTYTKPQLVGYSAIAVIQSGTTDKRSSVLEPHTMIQSIAAYEADE
jgi:hypothetical protein